MRDWLAFAMRDAGVVELRHGDAGRWRSGLFDERGALDAAIRQHSNSGNLFTTVNRPRQTVKATNAMGSAALADDDIEAHTRLLFDLDPTRPRGVPSTDDEMQQAVMVARSLMSKLLGLGWPAPAVGRSGNGAHLIFRVLLPTCADTTEMLAALYRGLHGEFTSAAVTFDTTTRNPARVWRLYGSENRKGIPTDDRPHRTASVTIPARWEAVSPRMVAHLAEHYARRPSPVVEHRHHAPISGAGDYSTLDVAAWFAAHDSLGRPLGAAKWSVLCPWHGEHSTPGNANDSSAVVWEAAARVWPSFHCSHAHCEGRTVRDVLALWHDADSFCSRAWERA